MTQIYDSSNAVLKDVAFHCTYNESQTVSIMWFKGLALLVNTSDYVVTKYAGGSTLTISTSLQRILVRIGVMDTQMVSPNRIQQH